MTGILLISIGWLGLFFPRGDIKFPSNSRSVLVYFAVLSLINLLISIEFFFIVPITFSLVSLVSFVAALALLHNVDKKA